MASLQQAATRPRPLSPGDKIAIASPAGAVDPALFAPAIAMLEQQGWCVEVMPHAMGRNGTYSGTYTERLEDMRRAILDPEVRAIMCGRGGYGTVHLLSELDQLPLADDPKWLIGFSDISALHGLWHAHGIASIHAPMLRGLCYAAETSDHRQTDALFAMLRGQEAPIPLVSYHLNRPGRAEGILLGGNLSVLSGLIGTKYDLLRPGSVLFLEDVNEPIYKIERILWQLRLRGVLSSLKGLIIGQFTGAEPDANHQSIYDMIAEMVNEYNYPVAYNAPFGHKGLNWPLLIGGPTTIDIF
ncbi:MAG: LD-carboxypeptidase [Bacteroidales bacterium]|nr:LD-carboxypeptidase [Bacteroidales bacterium]